jgi:succinate-semialdehyde dehydrogenase/glutarate-semialdehyde dehydrogenase
MSVESINPTTGEILKEYDEMTPEEIAATIEKADRAFASWRKTSFDERARQMRAAGRILREKTDEYARLMADEMGKPLAEGRAEAEKCAWVCEYYAESAEQFLAREEIQTEASRSFVTFEPLGVVMAVMPWNFPFWQVFRFAAPGLMAGNTGVLKHSSNVQGCALAIEAVFREAGFPDDVFRTLVIGSRLVDQAIEHPKVRAVTLTGSTPAGRAVASRAGELLKKTVLELGGSDPYVILEDADLGPATEACVSSRLINGGQSCIAAKRFIVPGKIRGEFEKLFVERMKARKMGNPLHDDSDVGPQARSDLRDDLHRQVVESDDELFGPVAAIIPVRDEEEAIRVANDSVFGLGAAVFTGDAARGEEIAARQLEAGCCFVNTFVRSDPRLPFGGVKESGYGRELGQYGIKEFVNIKTVYVQ